MKLLKTTLLITVITIILSGIGSEILLRVRCSYCTWTETNNGSYVSPYKEPTRRNNWYWLVRPPNKRMSYGQLEFDYELRTNSFGIRDIQHSVEKADNEFRIIGIGDSWTEGQGAIFDNTYLKILERSLNANSERTKFSVINGGIAGSDPLYGYNLLRDKLLQFKPDLVTLTINASDISDILTRGGKERFLRDGTVQYAEPPADEKLFALSHLYRFIGRRLLGYDWFGLNPIAQKRKNADAVITLRTTLADFQNLASREGFKFVVILHPSYQELRTKHYSFDAKGLKKYMRNAAIEFVDLLVYFAQIAPKNVMPNQKSNIASLKDRFYKSLFWEKDLHHNGDGYKRFAEGLEAYLRERNLIEF